MTQQATVTCLLADVQDAVRKLKAYAFDAAGRPPSGQDAEILALVGRLQQCIDRHDPHEAEEAKTLAFESGLDAARRGEQDVAAGFEDLAFEGQPERWSAHEPFCRIRWFEDSGDASVGIGPTAGWTLSENQAGTMLELLAREGTSWERLQDVDIASLDQRMVVIRLTSGVILFGRVIEGSFCEYDGASDRFVEWGPWSHISDVLVIPRRTPA
jgi:hypothetical protein